MKSTGTFIAGLTVLTLLPITPPPAHAAADKAIKPGEHPPRVEICFVLDTTGSMGGLIEAAKQKIWSIANDIASAKPVPKIRFALLGYRDRGDDYITKQFDMTDDLDLIYTELMKFQAQGGGDGPESVNQALNEAVTKVKWSGNDEVLKIVFLVGDAPPHMDYQDDVKFTRTCQAAVGRNLIINTLQCGGDKQTTKIWKQIAVLGEGEFAAIPQDGGTVVASTPVDAEIDKLSRELNATVVPYGDAKARTLARSKIAGVAAAPAEAGAARASFYAKDADFSAKVISGSEDLITEIADGRLKLDGVKKEELPKGLKELSDEELKAHVEKQIAARSALQARMQALAMKRQDFIDTERKNLAQSGKTDAFDEQVRSMIKKLAADIKSKTAVSILLVDGLKVCFRIHWR